jgi:SAM-dependent methyltransferase
LLRRGAAVDATDVSADMLAALVRETGGVVPVTVGDIRRLPLADGSYDISAAAFVITHLHDPALAVAELNRVTRPSGWLLATSFGADDHPVKAAVDGVLIRHHFRPPEWYAELKTVTMPLTATVDAFSAVASAGGLTEFRVDEIVVDFSDLTPGAVAAYRLGMAHTAPFVAALAEAERRRLTEESVEAVRGVPPLRVSMLVLLAASGPS